jgi:hypothetical protein
MLRVVKIRNGLEIHENQVLVVTQYSRHFLITINRFDVAIDDHLEIFSELLLSLDKFSNDSSVKN